MFILKAYHFPQECHHKYKVHTSSVGQAIEKNTICNIQDTLSGKMLFSAHYYLCDATKTVYVFDPKEELLGDILPFIYAVFSQRMNQRTSSSGIKVGA